MSVDQDPLIRPLVGRAVSEYAAILRATMAGSEVSRSERFRARTIAMFACRTLAEDDVPFTSLLEIGLEMHGISSHWGDVGTIHALENLTMRAIQTSRPGAFDDEFVLQALLDHRDDVVTVVMPADLGD